MAYLAAQCGIHTRVQVLVENAGSGVLFSKGRTENNPLKNRPVVKLQLRAPVKYSGGLLTRQSRKIPYIAVNSWEEEIFLVLAHELRHADQFVGRKFLVGEEEEAEVDAEVFAAQQLNAWRKYKKLLTE